MGFYLDEEEGAAAPAGFFLDEEESSFTGSGASGSWDAPETPDWSLGNEAAAVKNRAIEGGSDLVGFLDSAERNLNPLRMGGPRLFGLNENIWNMQREDVAAQLKSGAESIGLLGDEKAQTMLGNIAGEVAYNAPSMFLPGGMAKQALIASGLGGAAAGIVKNEGGTETQQALANLGGGLAPSIWQAGKAAANFVVGDKLDDIGKALGRKSLGARASDYQKSAKNATLYDVKDDEVELLTTKILDGVVESGELGTSRNPKTMLTAALRKEKKVIDEIGSVINEAEKTRTTPAIPVFGRASKYINDGNVPADEIDDYVKSLASLEGAIVEKGGGKLPFLQKQKVTWGKRYEEGNDIKNGFYQAVYLDLKETLEGHVPTLKELNKQEQKWKVLSPILRRSLGIDEAQTLDAATLQTIRTSGGIGSLFAPAAALTTVGGVAAGAPLVALGGAVGFANTAKGKQMMGRALTNSSKSLAQAKIDPRAVLSGAFPVGPRLSGSGESAYSPEPLEPASNQRTQSSTAQSGLVYPSPNSAPKPATTQAPIDAAFNQLKTQAEVSQMSGDTDLDRIVDQLEPALVKYESAGNPKAQSKENDYMKAKGTGTAKGLWQLLDSTGKEWHKRLKLDGEYDPFNAEQNATIGRAYLKSLLNHYEGDYELALTAYHTGMGTVDKLLDRTGGSKLADIKDKLGPEGRKYAAQVLKRLPKPIAVKA